MLKSHLAVLILGMAAGGMTGYIAGNYTQQNTSAMTDSLHVQLRTISNQLSASRYCDNLEASGNVESQQGHSIDQEYMLSELNRSIHDMVSHTVREQIQDNFALLIQQIQGAEFAAPQTVTAYDTEKVRAGIEQTEAVLDQAISSGVWTQYEKQAFNDALKNLTGHELAEAQRKFAVAINNGEIVLAQGVTPF